MESNSLCLLLEDQLMKNVKNQILKDQLMKNVKNQILKGSLETHHVKSYQRDQMEPANIYSIVYPFSWLKKIVMSQYKKKKKKNKSRMHNNKQNRKFHSLDPRNIC